MNLQDAPATLTTAPRHLAVVDPSAGPHTTSPHDSLPARLIQTDHDCLNDHDLLQLLLEFHHPPAEAHDLADTLLQSYSTAASALTADSHHLAHHLGLPQATITLLKTAEALGVRLARAQLPRKIEPTLGNYQNVIDYCRTLAGHRQIEELHLLFLNNRNALISSERHQRGTIDNIPVFPREICVRALQTHAAAIVLVHQHPSGDPTPSRADIEMTKNVHNALKTIGVALHDHIVISPSGSCSFSQDGLL